MIVGIGVDLVEVARMRAAHMRFGVRLVRRILTAEEQREFETARSPAHFLATRFAAKEAASKALGTGFRQGVAPRAIGVRRSPGGRPQLVFGAAVRRLLDARRVSGAHLSLSDERDYAVAYVLLEGDPPP